MPTLGEFNYDNLFAGDFEIVTDTAKVGADLSRGTVLGIADDGSAVALDSAAADGSKNPYAVLADNATSGSEATIYLTGEFNQDKLVFGGEDTAADHKRALRNIGIFLKENA
ncbi:head decoration protein [Lentibacillus sp. Marseille-P4043]|uniref:head decoration protein n=1 Tax=Lentibacillus sp. Marseille-P4043 TaxID=2040293 RepID=UPI000D0AD81A|nr:head decoration protein [Lentibacillus sp. Marseille-P4043]